MINKQYWIILLLFASFFSFSQKLNFNEQPLVFKESKTSEIIVIDNEETIIKLNKNVKIPLKHNGILGKLKVKDFNFIKYPNKSNKVIK